MTGLGGTLSSGWVIDLGLRRWAYWIGFESIVTGCASGASVKVENPPVGYHQQTGVPLVFIVVSIPAFLVTVRYIFLGTHACSFYMQIVLYLALSLDSNSMLYKRATVHCYNVFDATVF